MTRKHENLAASLQRVTEEIIFHLLNRLHAKAPQENVVLVGGCAMNSVANGKITRETPFKQVYVPAELPTMVHRSVPHTRCGTRNCSSHALFN